MTKTEIKQAAEAVAWSLNHTGGYVAYGEHLIAADELIDKLEAENQALKADIDSYSDETSRLATEVVGLQADKAKLRELSQTHVLVPREPTEDMLNAGESVGSDPSAYEVFEAMLRAAEGGEQ